MNKSVVIILFVFLFVLCSVNATKIISTSGSGSLILGVPVREYIAYGLPYTFHMHVYNSSYSFVDNSSTNCTFHMYNITGDHVIETKMSYVDEFFVDFPTNLPIGVYSIFVGCNNDEDGFVSTNLEVTADGTAKNTQGTGFFALIIFIPLFLALIFLVGGASFGKDHDVLRIFLYLLSVPMVWISLNWGVVGLVKFYQVSYLQESVASFTFWTSIVYIILISYFVIYAIWRMFNSMAQNKEDRLNY